jgi:transposase-like protein
MNNSSLVKWRHFEAEIIRTGEAMQTVPQSHNDSWRVDETYVKVKKVWLYPYRPVDSQGNTLELLLCPTRDTGAAKRFFSKTPGESSNAAQMGTRVMLAGTVSRVSIWSKCMRERR